MNFLISTVSFQLESGLVWALVAFIIALTVSYFSYPVIIKVSNLKGLIPQPNHRSVHTNQTPNLGGIGIFLAINLTITFLGNLSILAVTVKLFTNSLEYCSLLATLTSVIVGGTTRRAGCFLSILDRLDINSTRPGIRLLLPTVPVKLFCKS